jgi:hypothetical protein
MCFRQPFRCNSKVLEACCERVFERLRFG